MSTSDAFPGAMAGDAGSAGEVKGNHAPGRVRACDTTGLPVCLDAQLFIRLNAVFAVVHLLIGGVAALLLAMTRWPAVHLLPADWFYRVLTIHGLNMLIYWILFMEVAILYFCGTTLLNSRLWSRGMAWISFVLMLGGAIMNNVVVLMGKGDVLMTSYAPLRAHPLFYLGIIFVAVGTLLWWLRELDPSLEFTGAAVNDEPPSANDEPPAANDDGAVEADTSE